MQTFSHTKIKLTQNIIMIENRGARRVKRDRNLVKLPEGVILKTCPAGPIPDTTKNTAATIATKVKLPRNTIAHQHLQTIYKNREQKKRQLR